MSDGYILDGKTPVLCSDLMQWAHAFEKSDRRVASTDIGDVHISTVFLGLNHQWGEGPPLLFETMIFGGSHNEHMTRCSTWEQAEKMHADAVALVKGELPCEP